ncbi:hypothetical protein [Spirosoma oryzicola]|uniref:hypothetical protein n=1 Tax=Spirosoma oryzicola TaxID=2898794 RepID=UPI001E3EBC06|nr:hypothetical protein [Spirosoma oryzicola]UHG93396.1 hypothetical protein LQ777_10935 [Spirosoma oryzicola]
MLPASNPQEDKLSTDEAAQEIMNHLTESGYDLGEKVAISRAFRKLLRTEGEEAQKTLTNLLDTL